MSSFRFSLVSIVKFRSAKGLLLLGVESGCFDQVVKSDFVDAVRGEGQQSHEPELVRAQQSLLLAQNPKNRLAKPGPLVSRKIVVISSLFGLASMGYDKSSLNPCLQP